jgi:hypothetical protein
MNNIKWEDDRLRASEAAYESRLSDEDRAWLKVKRRRV